MIGPADFGILEDDLAADLRQEWQVWVTVAGELYVFDYHVDDDTADAGGRVASVRVGYSAMRTPRGVLTVRLALPAGHPIRAALDVREHVEALAWAGYADQPAIRIAQLKVDQALFGDDGTVTLTAASYEAIVLDGGRLTTPATVGPDTIAGLINQLAILGGVPAGVANPEALAGITTTLEEVTNAWDSIQTLADAQGWRVYGPTRDDGSELELRAGPVGDEPAAAHLTDGQRGTLVRRDREASRGQYANHVSVRHRWRDAAGVDQEVVGVASHPLDQPLNRRTVIIDRTGSATIGRATAAARAALARLLERATVYRVVAINHLWLRPDMVIEITDPDTGAPVRCLVDTVEFTSDGVMSVSTRAATDPWTIADVTAGYATIGAVTAAYATIRDLTWNNPT